MKKIFVTRKLLKENEEKLKELFDAKLNQNDQIYTAKEIIGGSKDFDGILSSVTDPINSDTISKLSSSIKIIANGAVGFGNIDIKAAKEKGITITNTPDVLTDATADIQILLLLGASRKAYEGRIAAETQSWKWSWDFLLGKQMSNKRLGILGMGRIGRAVAKRAKAFGMEIHYHNRSKLSADLEDGAIYHDNIKDLFAKSEFLSINCPATSETKNIINKNTLSYLKENEEKLKELFDAKLNPNDQIYTAKEIIEGSKDFDGILSSVTDPINSDTISKLSSSIKIIANGAVGFGNIDIKAAKKKRNYNH